MKDLLEDHVTLVLFVSNFIEDDFSHVWKLENRKESTVLLHIANGSVLGNDIVDISGKVSSRGATLNLLVKSHDRANLLKGHLSLLTLLRSNLIAMGDLVNLSDGVVNFSNPGLGCSLSTMLGLN